MDRRAFLAASALASFEGFSLNSAAVSQVFADVNQATNKGNVRRPVLGGPASPAHPTVQMSARPCRQGCSTPRSFVRPTPRGGLPSLCFLREAIIPIAALLFTCITSRMRGFTSWRASSLPKWAASACA